MLPVATFRLRCLVAESGRDIPVATFWSRNPVAEFGCGYRVQHFRLQIPQYAVTCFRPSSVVSLSHCCFLLSSSCCFRRELHHIGKWLRAMLMSARPFI